MTSLKSTFFWSPADVDHAFENHELFLQGGKLLPDEVSQLKDLPPKIARAARTIAEVSMPTILTVPAEADGCARLPVADAVVVQSSLEAWDRYGTSEGPGVASEHVADLGKVYDMSSVFADGQAVEAQLIGSAVISTFDAFSVAEQLAKLINAGEGETIFALGLAKLIEHHTWREAISELPIKDIVNWRQYLGMSSEDFARVMQQRDLTWWLQEI